MVKIRVPCSSDVPEVRFPYAEHRMVWKNQRSYVSNALEALSTALQFNVEYLKISLARSGSPASKSSQAIEDKHVHVPKTKRIIHRLQHHKKAVIESDDEDSDSLSNKRTVESDNKDAGSIQERDPPQPKLCAHPMGKVIHEDMANIQERQSPPKPRRRKHPMLVESDNDNVASIQERHPLPKPKLREPPPLVETDNEVGLIDDVASDQISVDGIVNLHGEVDIDMNDEPLNASQVNDDTYLEYSDKDHTIGQIIVAATPQCPKRKLDDEHYNYDKAEIPRAKRSQSQSSKLLGDSMSYPRQNNCRAANFKVVTPDN
ncbi:hypothetical protein SERLA73DRAFT_77388 [Serpula lacrymans var. lacrymans S7.3]|uniref:Uncharacterized protein n=1 Tax=Serpula lacrymans var. lacrymans (strain S7.3) TaxID=936435 RepID=F8QA39_SERL3|nr:hypothetical protein SERLA73DRAFT_77388 [Serpula lacrymans var. lacrymans S7.3]